MADIPRKDNHVRDNHPKDHAPRDHQSAEKASQNIQDVFLNTLRKERAFVTVFLLGGVKLTGKIKSFDKYSVMLESNSQEQLVFKHAISTVVVSKAPTQPTPAVSHAAEA